VGLEEVSHNQVTQSEMTEIKTSMSVMLADISNSVRTRRQIELKGNREEKLRYHALELVERIRLCFCSAGLPREEDLTSGEYSRLLLQWNILYLKNRAEEVAKYLSCNIFSYITGQTPLPEIDLPFKWNKHCLGPHGYRKRIRQIRLMSDFDSKKWTYAQAFLYLKKGTPIVDESFVIKNLRKHRDTLSKERIVPNIVFVPKTNETFMIRRIFKERVQRIVSLLVPRVSFETKFWEPSTKASFESNRQEGGQANDIHFTQIGDYEMVDLGSKSVQVPLIQPSFGSYEEEMLCTAVPICEPFKVRVITKGPGRATYALKGLQLALWKGLKTIRQFELVGRPVVWTDLPPLQPGEKYHSGDFSAATDNLARFCSRVVGRELALQLDLPEDLIVDSLVNNVVNYGRWERKDGYLKPFVQKNGQLMGSVLSFIVLNIVNAALLWIVKNPNGDEPFESMTFKVNGDDSIEAMNEDEVARWYELSDCLGLVPSVGKTYTSDRFAVINSELFLRNEFGICSSIPFVNGDFLQSAQGKGGQQRSVTELWSVQKAFLRGFDGQFAEMSQLFFDSHMSLLEKARCTNWTLPQAVGGLGLRSDHPTQISDGNRDRAFACISGWKPFDEKSKSSKKEWIVSKEQFRRIAEGVVGPRPPHLKKMVETGYERKILGGLSSLYVEAQNGVLCREEKDLRLTVREHVPRRYRNKDIYSWTDLLKEKSTVEVLVKLWLTRWQFNDCSDTIFEEPQGKLGYNEAFTMKETHQEGSHMIIDFEESESDILDIIRWTAFVEPSASEKIRVDLKVSDVDRFLEKELVGYSYEDDDQRSVSPRIQVQGESVFQGEYRKWIWLLHATTELLRGKPLEDDDLWMDFAW